MSQQFHLPRILGLLAAITCAGVTLAVAAQVTPAKHDAMPDSSGSIILGIAGSADSSAQGFCFKREHNSLSSFIKNGLGKGDVFLHMASPCKRTK